MYEEVCENGLVFDGHGAVHNHCNYNWAVDCGKRVYDDTPISSPGCLYQFGIYPVGEGCQTTFFKVSVFQSISVQLVQNIADRGHCALCTVERRIIIFFILYPHSSKTTMFSVFVFVLMFICQISKVEKKFKCFQNFEMVFIR